MATINIWLQTTHILFNAAPFSGLTHCIIQNRNQYCYRIGAGLRHYLPPCVNANVQLKKKSTGDSYVLILVTLTWFIQLASVPWSLSVTKFSLYLCPSGVCHDLCYCNPKTNICYTLCIFAEAVSLPLFCTLWKSDLSPYTIQTLVLWFSFFQCVWYHLPSVF